jgi:hypothetical protein
MSVRVNCSMLWADSKKREAILIERAAGFKENGYEQTSKRIKEITNYLSLKELPKDFETKWIEILETFKDEYVGNDRYKKECFAAIEDILVSAILKHKSKFPKILMEIYPLVESLREPSKTIGNIGQLFLNFDEKKSLRERFYGACILYLLFVEGIFDEWIRILYYLKCKSTRKSMNFNQVYEKKLWDIKREFKKMGVSDILFDGWRENKIRNSIGHARFSYDEHYETMTFVNIDPSSKKEDFRRSLCYEQFIEICEKIYAISDIPESLILLLDIRRRFMRIRIIPIKSQTLRNLTGLILASSGINHS